VATRRCLVVLAGFLVACGGSDGAADAQDGDTGPDASADVPSGAAVAAWVEDVGLAQYAGKITPVVSSTDGDVTTYTFDTAQGPMCLRGGAFKVGVRDAGSGDLLFFLQGGGVCSKTFCMAVNAAPDGVPQSDILNPAVLQNPVATWNVVFLPYCDGSFFLGDADYDDDVNGNGKRWHRGLANLTAGLEVAKMLFPKPARILLAGASGGAYGLLLAWPLLRHYYPDTPLVVMADSGIGVAKDGDDAFVTDLLDEFRIARFIPKDCDGCLDRGHMTGVAGYFLQRDPGVRFGTYSAWYDGVLSSIFMQIPGERFAKGLREQTDRLAAAYPDRFRRFVTDGVTHTTLLGDVTGIIGTDIAAVEVPAGLSPALLASVEIGSIKTMESGGVAEAAWLKGLIDGDLQAWVDVVEAAGTPPASTDSTAAGR
jgi:hypothetical protein